ncbi:MAG: hypothetical protein AB1925_02660 [Actinomycetota bacterium]
MTVTAHAPAHDAGEEPRPRSRVRALSIVAASLGTLVIVVALLSSRTPDTLEVRSIPAQPNPVSQRVAAPAKPSPPPAPAPVTPAVPTVPVDAEGFVGSAARCDTGQRAIATARTERSAIVVCHGEDGYSYRGLRLRDGAALHLDDVRLIPAGFEARNGTTTYRLTPTELVVIAGEQLQSRDRVVEYRAG